MASFLTSLNRIGCVVATLGPVGLKARKAPGTCGSLAALLPLAWARLVYPEATFSAFSSSSPAFLIVSPTYFALCLIILAIAWWATHCYLSNLPPDADPPELVIDEVAGLAIALWPATSLFGVLVAFLLFRWFDIAKPWPVSWADHKGGTFGVWADDVLAGLLAALLLSSLHWLLLLAGLSLFGLAIAL